MPVPTPWNNVETPVSVNTITELRGVNFEVEGIPCRVLALSQTWFSSYTLPGGMATSTDGSSGAVTSPGGFWLSGSLDAQLAFDSIQLTGRKLLDVTAAFCAGLSPGTQVWVQTIREFCVWEPTSTASADQIEVIRPTALGGAAGTGAFFRRIINDHSWFVTTHNWFIANTVGAFNDENDGATLLTPISSKELQRRTGSGTKRAYWGSLTADSTIANVFHIWFIDGGGLFHLSARVNPSAQGTPAASTTIILHGSATGVAGTGKAVLFPTAGTAQVDAVTAVNHATNTALSIVCNALPAANSWTALGLVNLPGDTAGTSRGRMTTGANAGGHFWAIEDLNPGTPKGAMLAEPSAANPFTVPGSGYTGVPIATFAPAVNDQFVIESLNAISLTLDVDPGVQVLVDSLVLSNLVPNPTCSFLYLDACMTVNRSRRLQAGIIDEFMLQGCRIVGATSIATSPPLARICKIANGYQDASGSFDVLQGGQVIRFMIHGLSGNVFFSCADHDVDFSTGANHAAGWLVESLGIVNVTNTGPVHVNDTLGFCATTELWGFGNAFPPLCVHGNARIAAPNAFPLPASWFYIACAGDIYIAAGDFDATHESCPVLDPATNVYFAANRLLSKTNLQATIAAGGFGGQFFDPRNGASLTLANQG